MTAPTLIIGGGLSGLARAAHLEAKGHDWQLIEARPRLGGRIESVNIEGAAFDLGPAWFWQGQPRMAALLNSLQLPAFYQYSVGQQLFEDEGGTIHKGRGFASMEGSYRLVGGLSRMIDGLAARLPDERISMGVRATAITAEGDNLQVTTDTGDTVTASQIILALPPRLAAETINMSGLVTPQTLTSLKAIPTWMAGQAKLLAVYDTPFWREAGLSGDGGSRRGPVVELHDASPHEGGPYALFGFVGAPPHIRKDVEGLKAAAIEQLTRLFGEEAANPKQIILKNWAFEKATSVEADHQPLREHPSYALPPSLLSLAGGKILLGSTETGPQFGGYLEGALEAAERCAGQILQHA